MRGLFRCFEACVFVCVCVVYFCVSGGTDFFAGRDGVRGFFRGVYVRACYVYVYVVCVGMWCEYVRVHVYTFACLYVVCMYVCLYVCLRVRLYVYMHACYLYR